MTQRPDKNITQLGRDIDELRLMRWTPKFHGGVKNDSAPGGVVDMWLLVDDATGESIVSLGVPRGRSDIAGYVAAMCGSPVRWVTSMWQPDNRRGGLDDPENILKQESDSIADALFRAYMQWMEAHGVQQANGWTLNDALSAVWYAFCGQLNDDMRGRLLFRFAQLATADYTGPEGLKPHALQPEPQSPAQPPTPPDKPGQ